MEQKAASLLATLKRSSAPADAKLAQLNDVKKEIKHNRVPEASQSTIFEALRIAISQQTSTTLVASGFSTLAHYIKRLALQEGTAAVASHGPKLFPAIVERLGDARESHRTAAAQTFSDFWPFCAQEVEHIMRDEAMTGNNTRAKEASLQWAVKASNLLSFGGFRVMSKDEGMQFKSFVPHMVACLEDSDGAVRDAARTSVVELFRKLPDRAKADLQRQLNSHSVRKSIVAQITSQLGLSSMADQPFNASTQSAPSFEQSHNTMRDSVMSEAAVAPPVEAEPMDPIYVHTQRELDDMLRDMLPSFEGKESEGNWMARDKN
ncbi:suppressor of tub2 mutation, partial [Cryomyces antarcticus]